MDGIDMSEGYGDLSKRIYVYTFFFLSSSSFFFFLRLLQSDIV